MEIIKYLCEFFFTSFWHFVGLWLIVSGLNGVLAKVYYEVKNKT